MHASGVGSLAHDDPTRSYAFERLPQHTHDSPPPYTLRNRFPVVYAVAVAMTFSLQLEDTYEGTLEVEGREFIAPQKERMDAYTMSDENKRDLVRIPLATLLAIVVIFLFFKCVLLPVRGCAAASLLNAPLMPPSHSTARALAHYHDLQPMATACLHIHTTLAAAPKVACPL